jgi:PAS domain S-box-containing protein
MTNMDISGSNQLRIDLEQKSRHLELMTSLAYAATEPGDVGHLIRRSLELIARTNECALAQYWTVNGPDETLSCSEWYFSSAVLSEFRNASTDRKFSSGIDLPGRAFSVGLPVIVPSIDGALDFMFTRKPAADLCNLKGAFAMPVKNGPFVTAICEFFSFEPMHLNKNDNLFYERLGVYLATLIKQREAAQEFHQQEMLNRIVLNHAYNAFVLIDQAGVIVDWTERAASVFGWSREEVLGKTIHDVIIPERYRDAHVKGLFRYMTSKEGPILDKRIRAPALHRNGHELPIELLIFPIEELGLKLFGAFIIECSKESQEPAVVLP